VTACLFEHSKYLYLLTYSLTYLLTYSVAKLSFVSTKCVMLRSILYILCQNVESIQLLRYTNRCTFVGLTTTVSVLRSIASDRQCVLVPNCRSTNVAVWIFTYSIRCLAAIPSNIGRVHYCQTVFGCELPSVLLVTRYEKFIKKLTCTSV